MHHCSHTHDLISLSTALEHYARLPPLPPRRTPLLAAAGEVLAAPVCAATDLPAFTQSAMDGYALRHADLAGGLSLVGEVAAGRVFPRALATGEAVRIFTGAALPEGADTVARQEIVRLDGARLLLAEALQPGQDVRLRGEELHAGSEVMPAGVRLTPGRLAALAMAGISEVVTRPRPKAAVIITGDEVVRQGEVLAPGAVHDANWPLIGGWLTQQGLPCAAPVWAGDDLEALTLALDQAAASADLVITTGGASVGRYDFLAQAAASAGFTCRFHGVAQRPGKPLWFGQRDGCLLLALPGNPAAVLAGLYVHAASIINQLQGEAVMAGWRRGRLASSLCAHSQVALLQRMSAHQDDEGCVWLTPLPHQASHQLSNLAAASALAWVPTGAGALDSGATLQFLPLA
jgi:molybdopterin molybdotransferase